MWSGSHTRLCKPTRPVIYWIGRRSAIEVSIVCSFPHCDVRPMTERNPHIHECNKINIRVRQVNS